MNEQDWKAKLRKRLDMFGISFSVHGHGMQAPGWPDLYVSSGIWSGWIELKSPKREMTPAQRIVGRKLERNRQFVVLRAMPAWDGFIVSDANEEKEESHDGDLTDASKILIAIRGFTL